MKKKEDKIKKKISYSVIIPAYNEQDNIEECISRIPKDERNHEIIVIDDGSQDDTWQILSCLRDKNKFLNILRFPKNKGKAFAIEKGIVLARNEAAIILDADMAVAPEEITLFIEALEEGSASFINGTRFIYPMEKKVMTRIKVVGNFLFARVFFLLLKKNITDTLCGTKAFFRKDFVDVDFS